MRFFFKCILPIAVLLVMALVLIFDLAPAPRRWPASPAMSYGGKWRCMDEHYKVWDARLQKDDTYWCFERDKPK